MQKKVEEQCFDREPVPVALPNDIDWKICHNREELGRGVTGETIKQALVNEGCFIRDPGDPVYGDASFSAEDESDHEHGGDISGDGCM